MNYQRKPIGILGWEDYECDTEGNVYSKRFGTPLKWSLNPRGYCIVNLCKNGKAKGFAVHTIIATTFLEHDNTKNQVNHKNGDKTDNSIENLEWVTPLENVTHARTTLGFDNTGIKNCNAKSVYGYDKKTLELKYYFDTVIEAGKFFSNNDYTKARYIQNIISQVALGHRKSYKKCIWKYGGVSEWHRKQT